MVRVVGINGTADRRSDLQEHPGGGDRTLEERQELLRTPRRRFYPVDAERDREFVPTQPRDHLAVFERPPKALSDRDDDCVADGMPEGIVDHLKIIEVELQDREFPAASDFGRPCERTPKSRAVGQAGE